MIGLDAILQTCLSGLFMGSVYALIAIGQAVNAATGPSGYVVSMIRASMIEVMQRPYIRTAVLKGLPQTTVIRRHVLRNSLLPTITVIATQTGYLIGGLVVVETLFNYQGLGNLIYKAAVGHDFAMLEAGVLVIGVVYVVATLAADMLLTLLNPRLRIGGAA